ncbi:hypothetical protein [Telluria mixta]|uniref:hypothetical protein n=1 Tax=Telluria mixta TaxID=34071 RepID=UPI0035312170
MAGHHLAYNITYNTGKPSATPNFLGVEPPNWTVDANGAVTVTAAATAPASSTPRWRRNARRCTTWPKRSSPTARARGPRNCPARSPTSSWARPATPTPISRRWRIRPAGAACSMVR